MSKYRTVGRINACTDHVDGFGYALVGPAGNTKQLITTAAHHFLTQPVDWKFSASTAAIISTVSWFFAAAARSKHGC